MEMTYNDALDTIIEHTEIGYTIASQDRLWIVFTFDLWSEGESASFRFNRLYSRGLGQGWAYDLDIEGVKVFTTRREAEAHRDELQSAIDGSHRESEKPEVYVMNLGDDARYEAQWIGCGTRCRDTPKFKGSEAAWHAMIEMGQRWRELADHTTEGAES